MVKFQDPSLDRTFAALADPTRRALVDQLGAASDLSISELAKPFDMSLPAVMKHLDVLSDAGLIAREKKGRVVSCRLVAGPMEDAMIWLGRYERFWSAQLDRLVAFVEEDPCPPSSNSKSPASPSGGASTRRRPKSTPPGPIRRK